MKLNFATKESLITVVKGESSVHDRFADIAREACTSLLGNWEDEIDMNDSSVHSDP